ncbi:uncharacterized protein [Temnothorax nylanderi]|uniref:uncharacterized protein n=1 Tax=Temnothorax nylanderi TaxID=102681 RepID=UPI003A846BBC
MSEDKVNRDRKGTKQSSGYEKRPKASSKRPLNRFELETEDTYVSTSAKKLQQSAKEYNIEVDATVGYRLINFIAVFSAISNVVVCKQCKSNVKFTESGKRGLGFKIIISCDNCDKTEVPNCPYIKNSYEINRRIILAMRLLGIGLNGILKFCAFMDLPRPIFYSFYDKILNTISIGTKAVCTKSMKNAVEKEKTLSIEKGKTHGITVSGDGTWRKRGFSSLFGLVSLIGWYSGKVVDIVVKSKYCKQCEYWEKKSGTTEYSEWLQTHASECNANHEESAGKMEVDAVIEMFQRSEELYQVKYADYIGDGDSKTFKGILDSEPYENFNVLKKECIDHVQKRMGTRLRNLKKVKKGLGEKGKLTGKLIDELSIYYGLAIRRNHDSVEKMRNDIWATLYHKISTDEEQQHERCPPGEDSWCSWQRMKAANTLEEHHHKPPLSPEVFEAIKPIYVDLSSDDLLTRCIGGYTQNSNESFNSTVWAMAPKTHSSGKKVLDIVTHIAVCVYNDGMLSIMEIMQVLGIQIGLNCYNFCTEADARRVSLAELSLSDAAKTARRAAQSSRKEQEQENINLEGQLYGAGIAD